MRPIVLNTYEGTHHVQAEVNQTIVEVAKQNKVRWGHACTRGICAQCRTKVVKGAEALNPITKEEKLRLRKEERQNGFRLGCQIRVTEEEGEIELTHSPY
ncbi:2Fe-2S iron-sulfur cluster-binding protein [Brevibacillus dissolubilis]|uniref:2Fe-2S iron-sulfur cluster-binding protein n=1 Tax=Brevibacillus dissolubilis TaxID=1844116 RepID=UPI0011178E70|nr:2Fe-2S iron-sulfur cluster-binding protein [Brevibacillus dissolubilis]